MAGYWRWEFTAKQGKDRALGHLYIYRIYPKRDIIITRVKREIHYVSPRRNYAGKPNSSIDRLILVCGGRIQICSQHYTW